MKTLYNDSPGVYNDYYAAQVGGNLPYFSGAHVQRSHGLGSLFKGLLRSVVLPTLKSQVPKRLVRFGTDVLSDVTAGGDIKTALKRRGVQQLKRLGGDVLFNRRGSPPGVPAKKRTKTKSKRGQRHKKDIFA